MDDLGGVVQLKLMKKMLEGMGQDAGFRGVAMTGSVVTYTWCLFFRSSRKIAVNVDFLGG